MSNEAEISKIVAKLQERVQRAAAEAAEAEARDDPAIGARFAALHVRWTALSIYLEGSRRSPADMR